MSIARVSVLTLGLVLLVAGCKSKNSGPELVPVQGVVKYKGELLRGATVTFVSGSAPTGFQTASGVTNDAGEFQLKCNDRSGATLGTHQVIISAPNPESPIHKDPRLRRKQLSPKELKEAYLIPVFYGDASKSGLSADVVKGNPNSFTFNLTEDGKGVAAP